MIRLIQGDCLEVIDQLIIEGVKVDFVATDLPYGTTQCKWDVVIDLDLMWNKLKKLLKDNSAVALFAQTPFDKVLGSSNIEMLKYEWIWEKSTATGHLNSKIAPLKAHENILIFYNKKPTYNPQMTQGHTPVNNFTKSIAIQKREVYGKCLKKVSGGGSTE